MALKRVPASIRASTTLARLDISSNRIADLESVPLNEIASLMSIKVQNNKLSTIPTYFAQMKSLKYLNISNNKFETFPAVVCEMDNLVDLDVSFNEIAEFPAAMSNLKSLERLAAYGNELTTFPESFSTLANLRSLDVRRNKLTDLTSVYALPNLAELQADHNNLVTLDAQIGAKVRLFSVPHNSVTRFTLAPLPNMAAVTYSLTHLNLSHGKISTLADEALIGLVNLVELNLNFNQFTRLPSSLTKLDSLEVLSCTDNMLEELPADLHKLRKFKNFNLHNNNVKFLRPELWLCERLETLNASSNLISAAAEFPMELFLQIVAETAGESNDANSDANTTQTPPIPVSNLKYLYLADNRFNEDIFHGIAELPYLKIVNLSFNDIFEIPTGTLCRNEELEELYLSGNKLTSLPSEDLEKLQKLRVLHLNGNKLQTLPSELGAIKSLRHLDVGSNVLKYNIANWPYDWNW
jgi:adenylate cyclase